MSYKVLTLKIFDSQIKAFNKKYPLFKREFIEFINSLKENPFQGVPLGNNFL